MSGQAMACSPELVAPSRRNTASSVAAKRAPAYMNVRDVDGRAEHDEQPDRTVVAQEQQRTAVEAWKSAPATSLPRTRSRDVVSAVTPMA
jgi:hypothetical protein